MKNNKTYILLETDELYDDTLIIEYFDNYVEAQKKADELNAKSHKYKYDFYYSVVSVQIDSRWR